MTETNISGSRVNSELNTVSFGVHKLLGKSEILFDMKTKIYVMAASRNVQLESNPDVPQKAFSPQLRFTNKQTEALVERYYNMSHGGNNSFFFILNRMAKDQKESWLKDSVPAVIGGGLVEGDFVRRTTKSRGNCLDLMLTAKVLVEARHKKEITNVVIIPFKDYGQQGITSEHFGAVIEGRMIEVKKQKYQKLWETVEHDRKKFFAELIYEKPWEECKTDEHQDVENKLSNVWKILRGYKRVQGGAIDYDNLTILYPGGNYIPAFVLNDAKTTYLNEEGKKQI